MEIKLPKSDLCITMDRGKVHIFDPLRAVSEIADNQPENASWREIAVRTREVIATCGRVEIVDGSNPPELTDTEAVLVCHQLHLWQDRLGKAWSHSVDSSLSAE